MSKLLEELMSELVPDIPDDAVTVQQLMEAGATRWSARKILDERVAQGWEKVWYKRRYWYWKPAD